MLSSADVLSVYLDANRTIGFFPLTWNLGALHLQDGMSYSTRVIFYKTYMPPQHLLGYTSRFAEMRGVNLTIADWRTKSQDELLNDLHTITVKSRANVNQTLLKSLRAEHGQQVVLFRRTKPRSFER